jgi:beta-lactamase class D
MMLLPILTLWLAAAAPPLALGSGECVVVGTLDRAADQVYGGEECDRRTLPASTFKVPHALVALDTGVLTEKTVMTWDGRTYDFPIWQRDHTLESAMKGSVVWFFQRAARSIGRERELQHLRAFGYGSQTFAREVDMFWLSGDLTISPREQVGFLKRMFSYGLPIDRRHVDTVKAAMTMPAGKVMNAAGTFPFALAWPGVTVTRLKTGNGTVAGERVSWIIGEFEAGGQSFVFASRARSSTRPLDNTAGADLAVRVLNAIALATPPR